MTSNSTSTSSTSCSINCHTIRILMAHLLTDWMQEVSEHQPCPLGVRIWHCDERHVVPDAPLYPEGMPQRQVRPIGLNCSMVLGALMLPLASTPPATHRIHQLVVHCAMYSRTEALRKPVRRVAQQILVIWNQWRNSVAATSW